MEQREYVCSNCGKAYIGNFNPDSCDRQEHCPKCNSIMIEKKHIPMYKSFMVTMYETFIIILLGCSFYFIMFLDGYLIAKYLWHAHDAIDWAKFFIIYPLVSIFQLLFNDAGKFTISNVIFALAAYGLTVKIFIEILKKIKI